MFERLHPPRIDSTTNHPRNRLSTGIALGAMVVLTAAFGLIALKVAEAAFTGVQHTSGIISMAPAPPGINQPPVAHFTMTGPGAVTVTDGQTLTIKAPTGCLALTQFSAASSFDPEGSTLTYQWVIDSSAPAHGTLRDFNSDLVIATHQVQLTVTDDAGLQSSPATGFVEVQKDESVICRFLSFPLQISSTQVYIDDGWTYCGGGPHEAVDYGVTKPSLDPLACRGDSRLDDNTNAVVAAASGWAVASKQPRGKLCNKKQTDRDTFGRFVLIWHDAPGGKSYSTLYAHLATIGEPILSRAFDSDWCSLNVKKQIEICLNDPMAVNCKAVFVHRGDVIGRAGDDGTTPKYVHLHFEVSENSRGTYQCHVVHAKGCGRVDPYGIYRKAPDYPDADTNPGGKRQCGIKAPSLWVNCPQTLP